MTDAYGITQAEEDWTTCRTRVNEARIALHNLNLGDKEVVVSHDGRTVTYKAADSDKLESYIRMLCRQCPDGYENAQAARRRRSRGRAQRIGWNR